MMKRTKVKKLAIPSMPSGIKGKPKKLSKRGRDRSGTDSRTRYIADKK